MPTQKPNKSKDILEKIFRSPETLHGLEEFADSRPEEILKITEEKRNRYYLKDLKSGTLRLVWDEEKQIGKPEEVVRQLWVYKLHEHYQYPLDRIDIEKSVHFGREIRAKAADVVVYKKDKITPYIIV